MLNRYTPRPQEELCCAPAPPLVLLVPTMVADALAAEKPSYNRGPDGRTPFGVPSYRATMCAATAAAAAAPGVSR